MIDKMIKQIIIIISIKHNNQWKKMWSQHLDKVYRLFCFVCNLDWFKFCFLLGKKECYFIILSVSIIRDWMKTQNWICWNTNKKWIITGIIFFSESRQKKLIKFNKIDLISIWNICENRNLFFFLQKKYLIVIEKYIDSRW